MIVQILALLRPYLSMMGAPLGPPPTGGAGPSTNAYVTLACGILSWLFLPLIGGVLGFFIGRAELKAIREGRSSKAGETITMIGYYVSIANVVLTVVGGCVSVAFVVAIYAGLFGAIGGIAILDQLFGQ